MREKIAKYLYELGHPRLYHTFEELKNEYPNSAEVIRLEAARILTLLKQEIEKVRIPETPGQYRQAILKILEG